MCLSPGHGLPKRPPQSGGVRLTQGGKTHSSPTEDLAEKTLNSEHIRANMGVLVSVVWGRALEKHKFCSTFFMPLWSCWACFCAQPSSWHLFGGKRTAGTGAAPAASKTAPYSGHFCARPQPFPKSKIFQFSLLELFKWDRQNQSLGDHGREICYEAACLTWPGAANCLL